MDYAALKAVKEAFEIDLRNASAASKDFIESRLRYIEERIETEQKLMVRCGECAHFNPYSSKTINGWCAVGGADSGAVSENLLTFCFSFRSKSKKGGRND